MGVFTPASLVRPIVQAPLAGGVSNPALAAAVSGAGGLGFLAAGYRTVAAVRSDLDELRAALPNGVPFGVNVFAPPGPAATAEDVAAYAFALRVEAERSGVALGEARWDDDYFAGKLDLLCDQGVAVVSFTFGCPSVSDVARLHEQDCAVWVTVTTVDEAAAAVSAGADALVVQGVEAGGHRGGFDDSSSRRHGFAGVGATCPGARGRRDAARRHRRYRERPWRRCGAGCRCRRGATRHCLHALPGGRNGTGTSRRNRE